jgi:hypothetical protein
MSYIKSRPRDAGSPGGLRTFHSRRFRLLVAVVLATLGLALNWVYLQVLWDSPTPWLEDFEPYYGAAERMLAGELPYTEAQLEAPVDAVCPGCYLYPPFLAQISAPLSVVPMEMAKVGWFAVLSAAAFASTWIASGTAGVRPTLERAAWCVAAVTFFFPVFHSNWLGNVGSLVALSVSLVALGGVAAGLGAAFGLLLKVSPGALVPVALLADRHSRRTLVLSLMGVALSFLLVAPDAWLEYPTVLRNMLAGSGAVDWNLSPANQAARYGASTALFPRSARPRCLPACSVWAPVPGWHESLAAFLRPWSWRPLRCSMFPGHSGTTTSLCCYRSRRWRGFAPVFPPA